MKSSAISTLIKSSTISLAPSVQQKRLFRAGINQQLVSISSKVNYQGVVQGKEAIKQTLLDHLIHQSLA